MVPPMSTTTASPGCDHPVGHLVVRAGAVRARSRRSRSRRARAPRPGSRRRCPPPPPARSARPAATAAPGRAPGRSPRPASRSAATSAGDLAHPQVAQDRAGQHLLGAGQRGAGTAAPSAPTCGRTARPRRPRRAAWPPAHTGRRSRPTGSSPGRARRPGTPGRRAARAAARPGTGRRRPGTTRQVSRSSCVRVVAGQVAQVRSGGEQQRLQAGLAAAAAAAGAGPLDTNSAQVSSLVINHGAARRQLGGPGPGAHRVLI